MIPGKLKWYVILALALWLAFSGVAAAEQLYVNESGWWRDGGAFNVSTAPIQAAVYAAAAGDAIFVYGGNYYENVDVDAPRLTLEGGGADVVTVTAASTDDYVFEVTKDYVNISGFAVRGATDSNVAGVYLDNADYCNISGNDVYGNDDGITLSGSSNNMLKTNTVSSNADDGIRLHSSSNYNTLTENIANSNNDDICLDGSSNNTLTNNTVKSKTGYGIDLCSSSNNNTIENNIVNLNSGGDIESSYGISLRYDCNYNMLTNNNCSNNRYGIFLGVWINYNTLTNNTVNSNYEYGIILSGSNNNTLENNNCSNNRYDGIILWSSSNNTLKSNIVSNNRYGISLDGSSNNALTNNTVNSNAGNGICLDNADNNIITCNLVKNNTEHGFYLHGGSTGNNISYNNVIENGNYNTMSGGWEWQLYVDQYNLVEARHSYWGCGMNSSTIDASIYDDEEGGWGEVVFYPFETEPVPCAPTLEEWHTAHILTGPAYVTSVAIGDVDNDGQNEIVSGLWDRTIKIWDYDGIVWTDIHTLTGHTGGIRDVAIGDIDNDGQNEIVSGSRDDNTARIWDWNGTAWINSHVLSYHVPYEPRGAAAVAIDNLDEDDRNEIVTVDLEVNIWDWNGTTWIRLYNLTHASVIYDVAIGDIDDDGKNEIITGSWWDMTVKIWDWNGTAWTDLYTLQQGYYVESIALGDIDGDNREEIIVGLYGESFDLARIWDWNGTAWANTHTLQKTKPVSNIIVGFCVNVGDTDGDGKNEIVTGSVDNTTHIWDWNGAAWLNSHTLVGHTSYINSVSIGDVLDDGKNEVVSGSADDSVRIWVGPQSNATPQKGDLNDDGKISSTDAAIALQIAVGSRPFDSRGDVNGDGSVTSLDALMILQAAADAIDL